jgi:uncharacterized LabA/DUF88 family protein
LPETAIRVGASLINSLYSSGKYKVIRRYWFSSYTGNDETRFEFAQRLRSHNFEPVIFRKKGNREKGVDIALTMSMLRNAFNQNYDIGLLVAGDEDYLELVTEIKRYGPRVEGAFLEGGLSGELKLAGWRSHQCHLKCSWDELCQAAQVGGCLFAPYF